MTIFLLILSILLGYIWQIVPQKEIQPFATDMTISSLWYVNLLCYKLRFVLLVGALTINLKGTIKMIATLFLLFYYISLIEYLIMYSSPYFIISFVVKSLVSLFILTLWQYGRRNNITAYD